MTSLKRSAISLPLLTLGLAVAFLAGLAAAPTSSQAGWTPPSFLDTSFNPDANGVVNEVLVQSNGKILIGGAFTTVGGETRGRVARLNADGTVDNTFADPVLDGAVRSMALDASGKILVGGEFTQVGGQTRNKIVRLNADGTLDTSFNIGSLTGAFGGQPVIDAISVLSDGKILIGGFFSSITPPAGSQVIRAATARLDSDGIIDTSYTGPLAASDRVWTLEVLSGGKILTGTQSATAANRLVLTDANGARDSSFVNPNPNEQVFDVAVQSDGKILAGGLFTSIAGETRNRLARLNADGTLDTGFNPNVNSGVQSVSLRADGKILIGGSFTEVGGTARTRVGIVNTDGTVNAGFFPTVGSVGSNVYSAVSQADGNILIGGNFTTVEGQTRNRVARVFPELAPAAPANTSSPTISGTAEVGQTLTTDDIGDWTGYPEPEFTYQWERCEDSGTYSPAILGSTGSNPFGIVVDPDGNVHVANYGGNTVTKLLPSGSAAGSPWPVTVGATPAGLALDSAGNVYSVNFSSETVSKITPAGSVSTLGATGPDPYSLALDSTGNVFTANNDGTGSGAGSVTKIPTSGSPSNLGSTGPGSYPRAIAVDSAGNVYTANYGTDTITKITAAGNVATSWASTGAGSGPYGIAVDSNGNVYTANLNNDTVSKLLPNGSAAGGPWPVSISPGQGPHGLALDSAGNVFTANGYSSNVTKITPDGTPTTIASAGSYPQGIALDSAGNVYTSNYNSNNVTKLTAGVTCTDISGATGSSYTLTGDDEGKKVRVKVTATNAEGTAVATSDPTATVEPQPISPPANVDPPTITGTPGLGAVLSADPGEWTGNPAPTFEYQWQRCDADGTNCTDITGANTDSYTQTRDDVGKAIRVKVTASNSEGEDDAVSDTTTPVPGSPENTGAPTVSGDPELGGTLTAGDGTWSAQPEPTFTYQWQRCDADGTNCLDISGADDPTYSPTRDDVGKKIRVEVTATNDEGEETANSAQAGPIEGSPEVTEAPTISGTPEVGRTLTADPGTWSAYPEPTFSYQWQRCDADGTNCEGITGADDPTYTLTGDDEGKTIRVQVTATNGLGSDTSTSEPTGAVAPPAPSGKPNLKVWVNTPNQVRAGARFKVVVKVKNRATANSTRARALRAGTTAEDVKTCARLPRGIFVVKRNGGKVSGRTICWTRSSLRAGRSATYTAIVRSSRTDSGSARVSGTATASNGAGATARAKASSRVKVVKPRQPRPKPPTG